jgi:hypothetical protein
MDLVLVVDAVMDVDENAAACSARLYERFASSRLSQLLAASRFLRLQPKSAATRMLTR